MVDSVKRRAGGRGRSAWGIAKAAGLSPRVDDHSVMGQDAAPSTSLFMTLFLGLVVSVGLFAVSRYSYPLFHTFIELTTVAVATALFLVVWNTRRFLEDDYVLFLAIAFLFVAGVDVLHTLAYTGISLFPGYGASLPSQLWLIARSAQAVALLVSPWFIGRRSDLRLAAVVYACVVGVALLAVFALRIFPATQLAAGGVTPFKVGAEWVIMAVLAGAMATLWAARSRLDGAVVRLLQWSIGLTILSELAFTLYADPFDLLNLVGHLLKLVAFYLLYKAIVATALVRPYSLLFRQLRQREADAEENAERYRATFDEASVGMARLDPDGRYVTVNDAFQDIVGRTEADLERLGYHELTAQADLDAVDAAFASVSDGRVAAATVEQRVTRADGTVVWVHMTVSQVVEATSGRRYYLQILDDISVRKVAEQSLRRSKELGDALTNLDAAMSATRDADEIVKVVMRDAAAALGVELAALLEPKGGGWSVRHAVGLDARRSAAAIERCGARVADAVAARTTPVIVADPHSDPRFDGDCLAALGVRSLLVTPLGSHDRVAGVLLFFDPAEPLGFADSEVEFAARLSTALSLALENAQLYAAEHRIADTLQAALLDLPDAIPGVAFAHRYRSATEATRVGGDFYDLFDLGSGRVGVIIGDVSGKGLEAAALTSFVKTTIKTHAFDGSRPATVMTKANDVLIRSLLKASFVTVFFGELDTFTGRLTYCSGGHPPGIVKGPQDVSMLPGTESPVLGAFPDMAFSERDVQLLPGDTLLLYTDGVTEARGGDGFFGDERLLELVASSRAKTPDELATAVLDGVLAWTGGTLRDDLAVLTLSVDQPIRA
jgi:PAS domain S-box-containing protein